MWSKTWKQKPMQWDGVPSIYPPPHSRNWLHGVERHCRLRPRKAWPRGSHIICIKMYKYHNVVIQDIQKQIILYYLINRHNIYSNCPSIRSIRSISKNWAMLLYLWGSSSWQQEIGVAVFLHLTTSRADWLCRAWQVKALKQDWNQTTTAVYRDDVSKGFFPPSQSTETPSRY